MQKLNFLINTRHRWALYAFLGAVSTFLVGCPPPPPGGNPPPTPEPVTDATLYFVRLQAIETDGGEDEPYFIIRDLQYCSSDTIPEVEKGEMVPINFGVDFEQRATVEVWDKDGREYDCFGSGSDEQHGSFDVRLVSTGQVRIGGQIVDFGEETTVSVIGRKARYDVTVKVFPK